MLSKFTSGIERAAVQSEQIRVFCNETNDQNLAGAVTMSLLVYVVHDAVPALAWQPGLFGLYVVTAVRAWMVWLYHRTPDRYSTAVWGRYQTLSGAMSGICWTLANTTMLTYVSLDYQLFILTIITVAAAVNSSEGFSYSPPSSAYILISITPPAVWLLTVGDRLHSIVGLMLFVFLPMTIWQGLKRNRVFIESLQLRFRNEALAQELVQQRDAAEQEIAKRSELEVLNEASRKALLEAQQIARLGQFSYDLKTDRWTSSAIQDEIYGIGDEFIRDGQHWQELIVPEMRQQMADHLRDTIERNIPFDNEFRIIRPADGKLRWVQGTGRLQFDEQGNAVAVIGTVQDITERKQRELALANTQHRLTRAEKIAHVGHWSYEVADGSIQWSDEVWNIFGREPQSIELDYATYASWLRDDFRVYLDDSMRRMRSLKPGEIIDSFVYCIVWPNGEQRWIEVFIEPEFDAAGKPLRFFGALRDITEIKRSEAELIVSKTDAERANLAKSRFLAAASHDLRQPIQAINLFQDALRKTGLTAEQARISDYLSLSARSLGDLLNALLDISRLDAGSVTPHPEEIHVKTLVTAIDAEFSPLALARSLRFRLHFPFADLAVRADPKLLQSLLSNLIGNAIKYTESGAVLVAVRRRGDKALIQVWDSGIGIAPEYLQSIFEEYFQVANPERDRSKGLGLGLAIVKRLAHLMETEVVCRSRQGKGSVFEFQLPLAANPSAAIQARSGDVPDFKFDHSKRHFVVVEDDPIVAQALTLALESIGMQVATFNSAEDALTNPDINNADFYISDFRLPGMNGLQFLNAMEKKAKRPIKAAVLTGDAAANSIEVPDTSGWAVLLKPIDLAALIAAVQMQDSMR